MDDVEVIDNWGKYLDTRPSDNYSAFHGRPEFTRKIFKNRVHVVGDKWQNTISFTDCHFEDGLHIGGELSAGIILEGCTIDHLLQTDNNTVIARPSRITGCIIKHLHFLGAKIPYLDIEGCEIESMQVHASEFSSLKIFGSNSLPTIIENCFIDATLLIGTILTENYTKIRRLSICGYLQQTSALLFSDTNVGILDVFAMRNNGVLRFKGITPDPQTPTSIAHIAYSNLGKTEFYECDLGRFDAVFIGASQLVDCVFINTRWPKTIRAFVYQQTDIRLSLNDACSRWDTIAKLLPYNNDSGLYFSQRETYRQLKYALSKQGDTISEQMFHVLEMKAYDNALTWRKSPWTKLVIKLSNATSEFGQSVWKPLAWLGACHFVLLFGAILSGALPDLVLTNKILSWTWGNKFIEQFFVLVNPLHRNDDGYFEGWTIIWDVLIRVVSSYMLYNFVRSTRRFIK